VAWDFVVSLDVVGAWATVVVWRLVVTEYISSLYFYHIMAVSHNIYDQH
jgi:hypothetical protein